MKSVNLNQILMKNIFTKPWLIVTMSFGQWDELLQAYYDCGNILLEVDKNEKPVKAYRKAVNHKDSF